MSFAPRSLGGDKGAFKGRFYNPLITTLPSRLKAGDAGGFNPPAPPQVHGVVNRHLPINHGIGGSQ